MTIEQKVAHTLAQGDLKHNPLTASGADVVGAMAFTDPMGSLLWRVLIANDKTAVEEAAMLLAKRLGYSVQNRSFMRKVARLALKEYVDARCGSCGGRGSIANAAHVIRTCGSCSGSGIAKANDERRIRELGCSQESYQKKWRGRMDEAYNILQEADRAAAENIRGHLKRDA